jgi:hypothetical protein
MMRPDQSTAPEPTPEKLDALLEDEELAALDEPDVPDDVKDEILHGVQRRREATLDDARPDDPTPPS